MKVRAPMRVGSQSPIGVASSLLGRSLELHDLRLTVIAGGMILAVVGLAEFMRQVQVDNRCFDFLAARPAGSGLNHGMRRAGGAALLLHLASQIVVLAMLALLLTRLDASPVSIRAEVTDHTVTVIIDPIADAGTLFIHGAPDLESLVGGPVVLVQLETPLTTEMRLPLTSSAGIAEEGYVTTAHSPVRAPSMVTIPAGSFVMGSPASELGRFSWEGPQTEVTFTNAFLMGRYEVTQAEYRLLFNNVNPSYFSGVSNRPVERVSWLDAMEYCRLLTTAQRNAGCLPPGWSYRLPTAAEWEYACRAGTTTPFDFGNELRSGMANFDGAYEWDAAMGEIHNPDGVRLWKTAPVGTYAPNAWGLYDMHGNVWEWCLDWFATGLPGGIVKNPAVPASGTDRVFRGGCWYNDGRFCRSAYYSHGLPTLSGNDIGFRVVLAPN